MKRSGSNETVDVLARFPWGGADKTGRDRGVQALQGLAGAGGKGGEQGQGLCLSTPHLPVIVMRLRN